MRVDKPIGFLLLMWPVIWAFLISSDGSPNIFYMIIFAFGIIFTRSAGCIINDYFDQDLEVKVKLVISNKSAAGALIHAENSGIKTKVFRQRR